MGVDIFFVISGYLITTIIVQDIQNKRFTVRKFYERRVRRIFPALFFVILCCIPAFWFIMLPQQFEDFSQSMIATSLFVSNIFFWRESGYFAPETELMPLLHTWSLAVEEQYYLFFPLMCMVVLKKWRLKQLLVITIVVLLISFLLCEIASWNYPRANFYLAPTRIWELFTGSVCAYLLLSRPPMNSVLLAAAGLGMIGISVFWFDEFIVFPSFYTLVPVIGTAMVILFSSQKNAVGRLLSVPVLVGIGLISYSAYLWHQPVFAFFRILSFTWPTAMQMAILTGCTFGLAYLSWKWVEQPFRRSDAKLFPNRNHLFSASAVVTSLFVAFGLVGYLTGGLPDRIDHGRIAEIMAYKDFTYPNRDRCYLERLETPSDSDIVDCTLNPDQPVDVILIGDSHADSLSYALKTRLSEQGINLSAVAIESCPPAIGVVRFVPYYNCHSKMSALLKNVIDSDASLIFLHARWSYYSSETVFDNGVGGFDGEGGKLHLIQNSQPYESVVAAYRDFVMRLVQNNKRVVVIYPVPEAGWDVPHLLAKMRLRGVDIKRRLSIPYSAVERRNAEVTSAFDSISSAQVIRVLPEHIFCDVSSDQCYQVSEDGTPYYRDPDHLSSFGAAMLADHIAETLKTTTRDVIETR